VSPESGYTDGDLVIPAYYLSPPLSIATYKAPTLQSRYIAVKSIGVLEDSTNDGVFDKTKITQSLDSVTIPSTVLIIGKEAFKDQTSLKTVKFMNGNIEVSSNVQSIGASAFLNCALTDTLQFGEGLIEIKNKAFENCASSAVGDTLEIILPASLAKSSKVAESIFSGLGTETTIRIYGFEGIKQAAGSGLTLNETKKEESRRIWHYNWDGNCTANIIFN
jgi:hypothetical protein